MTDPHHPGGEILASLATPLDLQRFLRIAIGIASSLARFHAGGLVHRDLKPSSISVDPESGTAWLGGLGLASRSRRRRQAPEPPHIIAGTLPYMAPEQTGRMNRSIDSRSDLYALGVVFYELIVGELPFTAVDPMELVHRCSFGDQNDEEGQERLLAALAAARRRPTVPELRDLHPRHARRPRRVGGVLEVLRRTVLLRSRARTPRRSGDRSSSARAEHALIGEAGSKPGCGAVRVAHPG